ncbi:hypothetical protein B0H19DRAFT_1267086 [Mycena capillaripes]|nr:hypothetical protein B0H19DRAFT_1267086 [Mycena capillaripes]
MVSGQQGPYAFMNVPDDAPDDNSVTPLSGWRDTAHVPYILHSNQFVEAKLPYGDIDYRVRISALVPVVWMRTPSGVSFDSPSTGWSQAGVSRGPPRSRRTPARNNRYVYVLVLPPIMLDVPVIIIGGPVPFFHEGTSTSLRPPETFVKVSC